MKIALLSHLASRKAPTGAERSLSLLALGLADRGHEVAVAAPGPWVLSEELEAAGASVTSVPVRQCWLVQYGPQPGCGPRQLPFPPSGCGSSSVPWPTGGVAPTRDPAAGSPAPVVCGPAAL